MQHAPLTFKNQYMFGRVMCREDICRGFIERVLGVTVRTITYMNREQVLEPALDAKGVRLDIYVETDQGAFDIEMQADPHALLGRRLRYYQSSIDAGLLEKGVDYDGLTESYIIFVCDFDAFGLGEPVYTIERTCLEAPEALIDCGSHWVVLNSQAAAAASGEGLSSMLKYIANGQVTEGDELVASIDHEVRCANDDARWVSKVFSVSTIEEDIRREARIRERLARKEGLAEGWVEGLAEGEQRYGRLVDALLDTGRMDDLRAAGRDPLLRERLYQELGIE